MADAEAAPAPAPPAESAPPPPPAPEVEEEAENPSEVVRHLVGLSKDLEEAAKVIRDPRARTAYMPRFS